MNCNALRAVLSALAFTPITIAPLSALAEASGTAPESAAPASLQPADQRSASQLPAVTVSGKTATEPVLKAQLDEQAATPGAVTVVDGEQLRQRNISGLADALRYVPGLWVAGGTTGDSTFFSARGSNLDATNYDGNGIKLLVDGLPVTAADGNNHNRDVDPLSARYVVVARGPNALAYGASTLGGAIDFITPTARDGAQNEVLINAGSHGQRQARATLGTVAGAWDALISMETRRSDGYRDHMRQDRQGLYANAGLALAPDLQTRFYATVVNNDQQLPGTLTRAQLQADPQQANASNAAGDYQHDVETRRVANKTTWTLDAQSSLSAGLSYESQHLVHPIVYSPPYFSLLIDTEQRTTGATLRYQRHSGDHDLLLGMNYGRTTVKGSNNSYTPATWVRSPTAWVDNRANSLELFALDRWQFASGWTAVYGAQAVRSHREVVNTTVPGGVVTHPQGDDDTVNPRAGLIRQLTPEIQLFANVSRTYEAPTTYELQDDARGDGSALAAMKGAVAEVGTRGSHTQGHQRWFWEGTLYYGRLNNEILSRDDPKAPGTSLSMNAGHTLHAGVEALLGASLGLDDAATHRIEPLLNLTVNHFKFDGDAVYGDRRLPAAPRYALKAELMYRHASGVFAGPMLDVVGSRWADFSNTYRVDGYTLWGLRGGFTAERWEVYAEARNLSDRRYAAQFSVLDKASANAAILTPGEPRSVYVGARMKF